MAPRLAALGLAAALAAALPAAPASAYSCLDLQEVCRTVGLACEQADRVQVVYELCHSLG